MSSSKAVVLSVNEWETNAVKYMAPKSNKSGGKAINIISKQTNRTLHFSTPLMMTWGISDFVNDDGESDGKYSISLNFPNEDYKNPATDAFLKKLKDFENQVLDDAVKNAELWWGEEMSREVLKHTFFPFLKYSKNKDTKKVDPTKPPSIRAKVPYYDGRWGVEIYDTKHVQLFPCDNQNMTPMDFVPKLSNVACVLQCGGIWIGGKGWGLTWKLIQCVVKPREVVSVYGKCHIQLSPEEQDTIEKQEIVDEDAEVDVAESVDNKKVSVAPSTLVEDSDDEVDGKGLVDGEDSVTQQPVPLDDAEEEDVPETVVVVETKPVKKVIKKAVVQVDGEDSSPALPVPEVVADAPKKKKVVKKAAP